MGNFTVTVAVAVTKPDTPEEKSAIVTFTFHFIKCHLNAKFAEITFFTDNI